MLAYFDSSLSLGELIKRTLRETQADNGLGLAAQLAYYFFLALFPALLFLIALASFLPAGDVVGRVVSALQGVAPPDVLEIIRSQLLQITSNESGGILTLGIIAALWSSSAAMVAIIDALNRAYDVEDARPWWKQRLTGILLTIGVAVFILVSFGLVVAGPELAEYLASQLGLGAAFEWTWKVLQWPVVFALIVTGVGLIYHFAPDVDQDWVWITPGALLATVLWLLGSLAFRVYVVNFGSYNETYGAIGGIMVLLTWLYMTGLAIIVGAEMNAEIEHASPHGKEAGEKVPGQRKAIGPRAARRSEEHRMGGERTPQPAAKPLERPRTRAALTPGTALARTGAVVGGVLALLFGRRA
ncbi:MAG TPA: YihY/virulence factor BrkB family protein [Vicinamibacterales bacterium]|nr:YihY/virulence factor BrkB family protein [Vicinamibacterales bacterium]